MRLHRRVILVLSVLLVAGSIASSVAYAVYLRSDMYRKKVELKLSRRLHLPTEVSAIKPLSSNSRQFLGVKAWLPNKEDQIFECDRATWRKIESNGDGRNNALDINDGWFLLGTDRFRRRDYELMLQSGLGRDFSEIRLASVHLHNMDVQWRQKGFSLSVTGADGDVQLRDNHRGRAHLVASRLNGTDVGSPININADFTSGAALRFHTVVLTVPEMPLASLGLDKALGNPITTGHFDGTVTFRDDGHTRWLTLHGALTDTRLEELTQRVLGGPFEGRVNVQVDDAAICEEGLAELRFSGELDDLRLGQFAPLLDEPGFDGRISLRVHKAHYRDGSIVDFRVSADATEVSLAVITKLLGHGVITGDLQLTINSLEVVEDRLVRADVLLNVVPPADGPGTIDKQILLTAAEQMFDFDISAVEAMLPEKVEYSHLGCRLVLDGEELTVRGTHGQDGKTILTVVLFGNELGLVRQPKRTWQVQDLIALVRESVEGYDANEFLRWWESKQEDNLPE